jgi:3-phosphoshikimate 1-carboxyvinyltransferase
VKKLNMNLLLQPSICNLQSDIKITGSKSETNRLLLLQALFPNITIENISNSDDSEVMQEALVSNTQVIDIHHAGTAMRFLTAFFAIQENRTVTLTGSPRMKERPIKILVDALRQLGAKIEYVEGEGFPPIKITGQKLTKSNVALPASVSSQYISALLLIASKLENGIELKLEGQITSVPYIKMTLALLNEIGVETSFVQNKIIVKPQTSNLKPQTLTVESDWSSASYFYSIVALAKEGTTIRLSSYKENSLQGDSALAEIYRKLGVDTVFENNSIVLRKSAIVNLQPAICNLNSSPDIAQTIVVTCLGLGIGCHLTGLHTLKIKETDRLEALRIELTKLGANISVTNESLTLEPSTNITSNVKIATYNDHRMAMAFAPLALQVPIIIENAEVVSKSFPDFWNDLKSIGFQIS